MPKTPSLFDSIGRQLVDRLPGSLRREVLAGSDGAIHRALEHVGAPHVATMGDLAPALFGADYMDDRVRAFSTRAQQAFGPSPSAPYPGQPHNRPYPSAPSQGTPHPLAPPAYPGDAGADNGGAMPPAVDVAEGAYGLTPPAPDRAVRRIPYCIWGQTPLAPGETRQTDPNVYLNGTGYPFIATHVTFSENVAAVNEETGEISDTGIVRVNPGFKANVYPEATRPWGKYPIDVGTTLDNILFGQIPTDRGFQLSHWKLDAPFRYQRNGNFYIAAANQSDQEVTIAIALIASKLDTVGTPRIFVAEKTLAANTITEIALDASQYKNDGDFDCTITDVVMTGGSGTWGAPATSPLVRIRPWQPSGLPDWMARLTSAVALNTRPGAQGSYWKLPVPQRTPPGTAINVQLQEFRNVALIANVGFVGYLEVPV